MGNGKSVKFNKGGNDVATHHRLGIRQRNKDRLELIRNFDT